MVHSEHCRVVHSGHSTPDTLVTSNNWILKRQLINEKCHDSKVMHHCQLKNSKDIVQAKLFHKTGENAKRVMWSFVLLRA